YRDDDQELNEGESLLSSYRRARHAVVAQQPSCRVIPNLPLDFVGFRLIAEGSGGQKTALMTKECRNAARNTLLLMSECLHRCDGPPGSTALYPLQLLR